MSRLYQSGLAILAVVVLSMLTGGVSSSPVSASTLTADQLCARANQFIQMAELQAARADFAAAAGASAACGGEGQRAVAALDGEVARLMAEAEALAAIEGGDEQEIVDKYLSILAIDSQHAEAREALTDRDVLPTSCEGTYDEPLALLDAGYDDEARSRARDALKESSGCPIPDRLTTVDLFGLTNLLAEVGSQLERWVVALGQVVLAVAAVGAIGWLLLAVGLRIRRHYPGSRKLQLVIGSVTGPKAHEDLGPDVVQILSTELAYTSSYAESMRAIGGGSTDLGAISASLPDQVRFVGPLLDWIRRPVRFTLNGRLVQVDDERVILNLILTDERGKTIAARRFTRHPLGDLTAARAASIEAAAWLAFQILELQHPRRPADTHRSILGTTSWASYGNVRLAHLAGQKDRGKLLDIALHHDRQNVAALREIGYAMTASAMPAIGEFEATNYWKGLRYIESAIDRLEAAGSQTGRRWLFGSLADHARFDPLWYQTMYALVLAQAHGYSAKEDARNADQLLHSAIASAVELARAVGYTQSALQGRFSRYAVGERRALALQNMLDREGTYMAGVLAGVLASYHHREINRHATTDTPVDLDGGLASPPADDVALWNYLKSVKTWPDRKPGQTGWQPPFDVLGTAQYLHRAVSAADRMGSDVLAYNRACTYARGRMVVDAKKELLASLDHLDEVNLRYTIDAALVDPALKPLLIHTTLGPQVIAELKDLRPVEAAVRVSSAPVEQSRWTVEIFT